MQKLLCLLGLSAVFLSAQTEYKDSHLISEGTVNSYVDGSSTTNVITATGPSGATVSNLYSGKSLAVKIANSNTGSSTLQLDSTPATVIKKIANGALTPLTGGELIAGTEAHFTYDGSAYELDGSGASSSTPDTRMSQLPTVSNTNPLYVDFPFRDDDQHFYGASGWDATHFTYLSSNSLNSTIIERDASWMYANGTFYFVYTGGSNAFQFSYTTTPDLKTFATPQYITMSTGMSNPTDLWAPEFFYDPTSQSNFVIFQQSNNNYVSFTDYIAPFNPSTGVFGNPTAITINGSTGYHIDSFLYYKNSTYYLFYSDGGAGTQHMEYATSSNLQGPYTQQTSANFDLAGFAATAGGANVVEAPSLVDLPNGCTRLYADTQLPSGYHHIVYYSDSCDTFQTWSTPQPLDIPRAEHGTFKKVTDPTEAALVLEAQNNVSIPWKPSSYAVGGAPLNYTFEVFSKATNGTFLYNEPATIAADPGSGHPAVLTACDPSGGANYCQTPLPNSGNFSLFTNSTFGSNFGILNTANAPAEMRFMDGVTSMGGGTNGQAQYAHAWFLGENPSFITPAGNYFYLYSGNTGYAGPILTANGTTGNVHLMKNLEFSNPSGNVNDTTPWWSMTPTNLASAQMLLNGTTVVKINAAYAPLIVENDLATDYTSILLQNTNFPQSWQILTGNDGLTSTDKDNFIIKQIGIGNIFQTTPAGLTTMSSGNTNNANVLNITSGNTTQTTIQLSNTNATTGNGKIHNVALSSYGGGLSLYDYTGSALLANYAYGVGLTILGDVTATNRLGAPISTPASSTAACTAGEIWADTNFIYVCGSQNSIKRAALSAF